MQISPHFNSFHLISDVSWPCPAFDDQEIASAATGDVAPCSLTQLGTMVNAFDLRVSEGSTSRSSIVVMYYNVLYIGGLDEAFRLL